MKNIIKDSQEYHAVCRFLRSKNIEPLDKNFKKEETTTDFEYNHENSIFKFQVTTPDGEVQKLLRDKRLEGNHSIEEELNKNIIKPIIKKVERYGGRGVSDTILLIHTIATPPFLEEDITKNKKYINKIVKESGFQSVFFVPQSTQDNIIRL